ncbi:hypothetical protein CIT26_14515 [Mesorhizobium temperatum]|uniref:Uncharacterized protein n=1 Tax=Mesorhizobium temperatum TaxID=241416 RepID=A0A271LP57_9HYPH|nr:hypothetical protein CIT26_14515 [Mesorhizobium temperatum]
MMRAGKSLLHWTVQRGIQPRMKPATRTVRIIDSGTARRQHASKVLICQEFIGRFSILIS